MFKLLTKFFKEILFSRTGQLFFLIHTILAVYVTVNDLTKAQNGIYEQGKLWWTVVIADFPSLLVWKILILPLNSTYSLNAPKWISAVSLSVMFLCTSIQWWLTGYGVGKFYKLGKSIFNNLKN